MAAYFLDLDHSQCYPGTVISGKVTCMFDGRKKIDDIVVELKGEEHTEWMENTSEDVLKVYKVASPKEIQYLGHNCFLSRDAKIPGNCFEPGRYIYQFSFRLAKDIPGSYDSGGNNYVKYYVKFVVKSAQENTPITVVKDFEVIPRIQLKNFPEECHKLEISDNGWVKMNMFLEKNIFITGDEVRMQVTISNPMRMNLSRITAEVGMNIESTALTPTTKSKVDYAILIKRDFYIQESVDGSQYTFQLIIPEDAPVPNFIDCKLFKFFPVVTLTATLPNYKDVTLSLPITLGHVISATDTTSTSDTVADDDFVDGLFELIEDCHIINTLTRSSKADPPQDPDPDPLTHSHAEAGTVSDTATNVDHSIHPELGTGILSQNSNSSYTETSPFYKTKSATKTDVDPCRIHESSADVPLLQKNSNSSQLDGSNGCSSASFTHGYIMVNSPADPICQAPLPLGTGPVFTYNGLDVSPNEHPNVGDGAVGGQSSGNWGDGDTEDNCCDCDGSDCGDCDCGDDDCGGCDCGGCDCGDCVII